MVPLLTHGRVVCLGIDIKPSMLSRVPTRLRNYDRSSIFARGWSDLVSIIQD